MTLRSKCGGFSCLYISIDGEKNSKLYEIFMKPLKILDLQGQSGSTDIYLKEIGTFTGGFKKREIQTL